MSNQGQHAEFSSAQNFHPEFGYFCPSARMRRRVCNALMTVVAGMMIAAGAVAALAPQLAPPSPAGDVREEAALSAMALPPLVRAAGMAEERMPAATTPAAPVTEGAAPSRTQTSCDDLSGSFLAPRCQSGKAGKSHPRRVARAAGSRVATIPIGRADAGEADPQRAMAAETAEAAVATKEVTAALPSELPPAPAKKPVKMVHKQSPNRGNAEIPAAPAFGFGFFGFFHEPPAGSGGVGHVAVKPARGPA